MTGSLQYSFPENGGEILRTLNTFRQKRYLCDVIVTVGDNKYLAHSLVLAASSKFIQSQLQSANKHGAFIQVISLDNIDFSVMAAVIEYFYLSTISVNIENVWMLLPAACTLQLGKLVKLCCDYFSSILTSDNCFRIRRLAAECSCTKLVRICHEYIQDNFTKMLSAATFKTFSQEDIISILTDLQGSLSKDRKMQAVGKWLEHRTDTTRQQVLSTVMKRFPDLGEPLQSPSKERSFTSVRSEQDQAIDAVFICDDCDWTGFSQTDHDQHALLHGNNAPSSSLDIVTIKEEWPESDIVNDNPYAVNQDSSSGLPYRSVNSSSIQSSVAGILFNIPEKPTYRCTLCRKVFSSPKFLAAHRRNHIETKSSYQDVSSIKDTKTANRQRCFTSRNEAENESINKASTKLYSTVGQGNLENVLISDSYKNVTFTASSQTSCLDQLIDHNGIYNCEFCGKRFPNKANIRVHRRIHTGERPHGCEFCGKRFKQRAHLIYHRRSHTGERPFACTICGKAFSRSEILRNHMKRHKTPGDILEKCTHKDVVYSCVVCSETFNSNEMLETHRLIHQQPVNDLVIGELTSLSRTGDNDQPSVDDPITDEATLLFSEGIQDDSNDRSEDSNLVCSICGTTASDEAAFKEHLNDHGIGGDVRYTTDPEFISNSPSGNTNAEVSMNQSRIHNIKRSNFCPFCSKVCLSSFSLKSHMRTHTGERPFKCDVCNKRFIQCSHMRNHMRQHTGERPFKCSTCAKCFTRKNILRAHMVSHGGNYKFIKCKGCGGSYSSLMQAEHREDNPLSLCVDCLVLSKELSSHAETLSTFE